MSIPIQNPEATLALQELYDLVGQMKFKLDETISPVAVADDGWRRVTYIGFQQIIPEETSAGDRPLHAPSPDFSFTLLHIVVVGTGGLAGSGNLKLDPQAAIAGQDLRYRDFTLDGLSDPETVSCFDLLGGHMPTAPPNMGWEVRNPATLTGDEFEIRAILAQVPRGMRLFGP